MKRIFALVDCNNFFVSCERIFRPDLEGKPVVVLSSNDGCAVARSNEAKALGIPMGAPVFKHRQLFKDRNVVQFSGNFELYGDVSRRIVDILTGVCPRIEVYSVDESFLDITDLAIPDIEAWGRMVRARVLREIGVPVSIGIAPSKTLAKLASEVAKKQAMIQPASTSRVIPTVAEESRKLLHRPTGSLHFGRDDRGEGVFSLINKSSEEISEVLAKVPIKDVWGVGWRLAPKLKAEGVGTALALAKMSPRHAQQLMGIHGRQMVAELGGTACYPTEQFHKERQSLACTRTFGEDTSEAYVLEAAVASLAAKAAFRLRRSGLLARYASLFITTNKHKPGYRWLTETARLNMPTNDSGLLISRLVAGLGSLYNPQQSYHRAGVLLSGFVAGNALQTDLLGHVSLPAHQQSQARMAAIDAVNARFGPGRLRYAAEDLSRSWQPKHQLRSPNHTTQWNELPRARVY